MNIKVVLFCAIPTIAALPCLVGCSESVDESAIFAPGPSGNVGDSDAATTWDEGAELEPIPPVPSETGPWPKAVAEEVVYVFGKMPVGGERDHVFHIANTGDADLELVAGKSTCKCTAFNLSSTLVKPGESSELLVRWHGKFKDSAFQHGGPVYTNDPRHDVIRFAVKGIVDANLDVLPQETWNVGDVPSEGAGSMTGLVMSKIHESFSITDVQCDSEYVTTEISPASDEQKVEHEAACAYNVKVTVDSSMPPGLLEEKLTLKIDCEDTPVTLTVTANKAGPIRIIPKPGVVWSSKTNILRLGQFSSREGREASLILLVEEPEGTDPLEFTEIEANPTFLKAELVRVGSVSNGKARYELNVSIPPGIPQAQRTKTNPGVLDIKTNHPSGQTLRMKVIYKSLF